ncbi:Uncharacterised protein [Halioglobus japonicus]|nr:Uncharacterised protein [Halioglobus japonicus]
MENEIIEGICISLASLDGNDLNDVILRCAFCFENYKGLPSDAWPEDISSVVISESDAAKLKQQLVNFIKNEDSGSPLLGSAIWALGKSVVKNDIEFLVDTLKRCLCVSSENLYQVMCVLDLLGENVLGSSSSLFDSKENQEKAICYLNDK